MPNLRKQGRRWVTPYFREVALSYQPLDDVIRDLQSRKLDFVPGSAMVHVEPGVNGLPRIVLRGDRYATTEEVRVHTDAKRIEERRELERKRDRINAALDVLRKEAPAILNRNDITADDVLEEVAV